MASRGPCIKCGQPVLTTQDRLQNEYGQYSHQVCPPTPEVSRGLCTVCRMPVLTTQNRIKDPNGTYMHEACERGNAACRLEKSDFRWPVSKDQETDAHGVVMIVNAEMKRALDEWAMRMTDEELYDGTVNFGRHEDRKNQQVMYVYERLVEHGALTKEFVQMKTLRMSAVPGPKMAVGLGLLKKAALDHMARDAKAYQETWSKFVNDPALTELAHLATQYADLEKPKQRFGDAVTINHATGVGGKDTHWAARDGNMLHLEAQPSTVLLLAEASECFPLFQQFVRIVGQTTNATNYADPHASSRKRLKRAAEKVARTYLEWPSVTDLVRGSLVYETPRELLAAFQTLTCSRGVKILRVKNRFHAKYNADAGGGYRDFSMNLSIPGSAHVCELQLNLREIYDLKTGNGEGHKHYVEYRNAAME